MPLPGGPSDKAGNRYEAWWTVVCMARVLKGQYDSIRLEPPGTEGQGIEFCLRRGSKCEYHQVKRQRSGRGHWSVTALNEAGVLTAFRSHLEEEQAGCMFVSMQDAHKLRELTERARSAADFAEFEREFVKGVWGQWFLDLLKYWPGCSRQDAFSLVKRIHVRTIDEDTLRRHGELELTSLVEGDSGTAAEVLFTYALEAVHQESDAAKIARHLEQHRITRPVWAVPSALSEIVKKANERYIARLQRELIRGELIRREESALAFDALRKSSGRRGVLITGDAGSGKSTVLLQLIQQLQEHDIPTLAFRIDQLEPTQQPNAAGQQLGLPRSPVATLAALANGEPCILVLDQLDAVSFVSGRNPQFFECFDEMIRQALTLPEMRVVIACRRFDLDNDPRLRQLAHTKGAFERITVGALSEDVVRRTLEALGIEPSGLGAAQRELLRVAENLKLICDIPPETVAASGFRTAHELYDLYWERKDQLLRARLGPTVAWTSVIDETCKHMSDKQVLSAPATILDNTSAARDALLSEHVLVKDGMRVSFFHEGFFDYAFARRFVAKDGDLTALLHSTEQHLFRRAQVRQILLHLRELDRPAYIDNLSTLLTAEDIRYHVKQTVFALLAQLPAPNEDEWRVLAALLDSPDYPHHNEVWWTIRALPWFRLLDSLGVVASWLEDEDPRIIDRAVSLLYGLRRDIPDRVAELVEPHLDTSPEWRERHRQLVYWPQPGTSRRFFKLLLRLFDTDRSDVPGGFADRDFLSRLYNLMEERADWACEAIGRFLNRYLEISLAAGETNPFNRTCGIPHSQASELVLIGAAQRAPQAFAQHVLPFMLHTIELNAQNETESPRTDTVWRYRHVDGGHGVDGHLLGAADEALRRLAREDPDALRRLDLRPRASEYETVQFLLLRAYAANGEAFADEALDYLCRSPRRLCSGYISASHRVARELIEAATPHCSSEQLAKLETMLLAYHTDYEQSAHRCRWRGTTQLELLQAIASDRRSDTVRARIGEWQRKLGTEAKRELPRGVYTISSPISAAAAEKMTDNQWLAALKKHSDDSPRWRGDGRIGGAHELSGVLESQTKEAPARFAKLLHDFPDDANPLYFDAVLSGLHSGTLDTDIIFAACRRCNRIPSRPVGAGVCRLMRELPELPWPDDLLDAAAWYATEDPDPAEEVWKPQPPNGEPCYNGDPYNAGINSTRGAAARTICTLLSTDPDRLPRFLSTLRRMVQDPSVATRSCVATALLPVLNHDRDTALALFLELCATEDALLKTYYVEEFIQYATMSHFDRTRPLIGRMLDSLDPAVAQTGARRACIASFDHEEAMDLAERCLAGSEPLRKGAAEVFSANVNNAAFRTVCESRLIALFDDPSEEVREIASQCFGKLKEAALGQVPKLIAGFQTSAAFGENLKPLLFAIKHTTAQVPDTTISICERFIDLAGNTASDIQTRAAYDAHLLSELVIRAYRQASTDQLRSRCLDAIDKLLKLGAIQLQQALEEFDR